MPNPSCFPSATSTSENRVCEDKMQFQNWDLLEGLTVERTISMLLPMGYEFHCLDKLK